MMRLSEEGLSFIKEREGLELMPYQDDAGVWTVGYGSTSEVVPGEKITEVEAEERLKDDLRHAENCVNKLVTVPLSQNEFDCLVSFAFNVGCLALRNSSLLKRLNDGDYESVPVELARWDKITDPATGRKVANRGLAMRRKLEGEMWDNIA